MPVKKKTTKRDILLHGDGDRLSGVNAQYDREALESRLADVQSQVDQRCADILEEARRMASSIRTKFAVEVCKLPSDVRSMSLRRFREEYNEDIAAVRKAFLTASLHGGALPSQVLATPSAPRSAAARVLQTPGGGTYNAQLPFTPAASRSGAAPATGKRVTRASIRATMHAEADGHDAGASSSVVELQLDSGDTVTVSDADAFDPTDLPADARAEAMLQLQGMVDKLQGILGKLKVSEDASR